MTYSCTRLMGGSLHGQSADEPGLRRACRVRHALADLARAVLPALVVAMEEGTADRVVHQPAARLLLVQLPAAADHLGAVRAGRLAPEGASLGEEDPY